jgi:hypothetical protein
MVYPEIRGIHSSNLEPPNLPEDPSDCEICFQVIVGPKDGEGEEAFSFTVITPIQLAKGSEAQWGRGKLIVPAFDWSAVAQAIAKLFAHCPCPTWREVKIELSKELLSEFDVCKPADI